jgi:hypothetical protein
MMKAAFREAWERFYGTLTPHMQHWHHHQNAAASIYCSGSE